MKDKLMDLLDIPGWSAALYFAGSDGGCEEAPGGVAVDDPRVVRREQWIVSGDQYIYYTAYGPVLGEHGDEDAGCSCDSDVTLPDLIRLVRARLIDGHPESEIHPLLVTLVKLETGIMQSGDALDVSIDIDPKDSRSVLVHITPMTKVLKVIKIDWTPLVAMALGEEDTEVRKHLPTNKQSSR